MNRGNILSCFGIEEKYLSSYDFVEDHELRQITIFIEFLRHETHCPHCQSKNIKVKGYYTTTINGSIIKNYTTLLIPKIRRYKCSDCGKTFKENSKISTFKSQISNKAIESIKMDLCKKLSYAFIAKEYGVSRNTIINIFDTMKEFPRGKLPKVMCVDEFEFSNDVRRKKRYPFVISEPFESSIIDVVEYRTKDVLSEYFEKIPRFERNFVDFYITDMHETYRIIKKKYFPKAVHIIDHFHVAQLFTNKLQSMRIRLMKEYKNEEKLKEYKCLKTNWKYFLMRKHRALEIFTNEDGVVEDIYFTIQDMFRHYEDFNYLYNAREEFFDTMVKMKELEETKKSMDFFINKFLSSTIIEVQEIGKSLSNRYDEIVNAYAKNEYGFCLTNAVAESNNNYIKELIHISHGFTNFTRFRKRILYINASRNHYKKG